LFGEEKQHFSTWQHSFRMEKENASKRERKQCMAKGLSTRYKICDFYNM
jgi:hypothetical protein